MRAIRAILTVHSPWRICFAFAKRSLGDTFDLAVVTRKITLVQLLLLVVLASHVDLDYRNRRRFDTCHAREPASRGSRVIVGCGSRIPPFFFGITLVAIGTDLPEMANSIAASVSGHGDINVGDSVGSVATQITLILGLLALIAGTFQVKKAQVALMGGVTILSLAMGAVLLSDGHISRSDSLVLILAWLMASVAMWRQGSLKSPSLEKPTRSKLYHGAAFFAYLTIVGLGATLAVTAFVKISTLLSVPEYLVAFFATSIGTSLPELLVDVTALRQGHHQLAIGGIFGASLVDSSFSLAIGPLIAPTHITADLALRGSAVAAIAVLSATLLLALTGSLSRKTGLVLLLVYAAVYPLLLWGGGLAPG